MIFTSIILIFFNSFIFLIENIFANNIFALQICFCWFTWVCILVNQLKNIFLLPKENHINLNLYKLRRPTLSIILVLLYITCFITTLFLLKIYRSVREVSLKGLYFEILNYYSSLDFAEKVCTILFLLTLLYLAIKLTKIIKNLIFNQIIKVHIYYTNDPRYFNYVVFIGLHCHMTVENTIVCFFSAKVNFLNTKRFYKFVVFLVENLVFILIFIFIFYDIYFNDFVLTKVFYILPPCFLYSQWLYLSNFYTSKDIFLDDWIHKYLYTKIFMEDENIIKFEDGSELDLDTRIALDNYIKKGFRTS